MQQYIDISISSQINENNLVSQPFQWFSYMHICYHISITEAWCGQSRARQSVFNSVFFLKNLRVLLTWPVETSCNVALHVFFFLFVCVLFIIFLLFLTQSTDSCLPEAKTLFVFSVSLPSSLFTSLYLSHTLSRRSSLTNSFSRFPHLPAIRCPMLCGCCVVVESSCGCNATSCSVLQTKAAYVLFYQRRDEDAASKPQPSASLGGAPETADDHMDTNWGREGGAGEEKEEAEQECLDKHALKHTMTLWDTHHATVVTEDFIGLIL